MRYIQQSSLPLGSLRPALIKLAGFGTDSTAQRIGDSAHVSHVFVRCVLCVEAFLPRLLLRLTELHHGLGDDGEADGGVDQHQRGERYARQRGLARRAELAERDAVGEPDRNRVTRHDCADGHAVRASTMPMLVL